MSELFLQLPSVGNLYFHHTYLFYDEPLIFSCATNALQYYFVLAIPSSLNQEESWLVAPISTGRLSKAERNTLEIREILENPETLIYLVNRTGDNVSARNISPTELTDDMLPEAGTFLDYQSTLEIVPPTHAPIEQAVQEMRDVIEISLEKDNGHTHELPCLTVVDMMDNVQQLVYALANKDGSIRGPIPQKIRDECSLCLTGMFAASVGVRLKSDDLCDMYKETPLTSTLRELNYLFEIADNKDKLKDFLSTHSPRVAYRFKSLLRSLLKDHVGIKINNASPNNTYFTRHFSTTELAASLALVENEIEEMVEVQSFFGQLVGANVARNTFDFETTGNEHIRGTIAPALRDSTFSVPQTVEISVEMRIGQDTMTRAEKIMYTLVDIKEIVPIQ